MEASTSRLACRSVLPCSKPDAVSVLHSLHHPHQHRHDPDEEIPCRTEFAPLLDVRNERSDDQVDEERFSHRNTTNVPISPSG